VYLKGGELRPAQPRADRDLQQHPVLHGAGANARQVTREPTRSLSEYRGDLGRGKHRLGDQRELLFGKEHDIAVALASGE